MLSQALIILRMINCIWFSFEALNSLIVLCYVQLQPVCHLELPYIDEFIRTVKSPKYVCSIMSLQKICYGYMW